MKTHNIFLSLFFLLILIFSVQGPVSAQLLQQGNKLLGTGTAGSAEQGWSVALSAYGNTAIVGGVYDSGGVGAAWIFVRSSGLWTQQGGKLVATDAAGMSAQGTSVSISADGNTAIVGGPGDNSNVGSAWIFTRSAGVWTQQGSKLVALDAQGSANFGSAVAISADGNTAIIGGYNDNGGIGAAWVFTRSGGIWAQEGSKLGNRSVTGNTQFGCSVSISADGTSAIIGGDGDSLNRGAAWVFTRAGGEWSRDGHKLVGTGSSGTAYQGCSVALSADASTAIVGGYNDNAGTGAAWVYSRSGAVWTQQGNKLVGAGAVGAANQGCSVSLSSNGNSAIVGGNSDSSGAGAAWVFTRTGSVWTVQGSKLVGTNAMDPAGQGTAVSISADGNSVIVGGSGDDSYIGATWVYAVTNITQTCGMSDGWNMVSVPLTVNDYTKSALYPTSSSLAFAYEGGYVGYTTLKNGTGYWLKFSGAQSAQITGTQRTSDTLLLLQGWNMIGGLSVPVPTSTLLSNPPGIVTSNFFGYAGSYFTADTIKPGMAYWVNVNQTGQLILSSGAQIGGRAKNRIKIVPTAELPPPPPGTAASSVHVPMAFALAQSYPNPFNPAATIRYDLPLDSWVTLKVYDMLGREVATLVNGMEAPGIKQVTFNAGSLPTGVYTYRLTAGSFVQTKKMMLMK